MFFENKTTEFSIDIETDINNPPIHELERIVMALAQYAADDERHHYIRELLQVHGVWDALGLPRKPVKKNCPPPVLPQESGISVIQTGLFDNWPNGTPVQKNPNRYGLALEVWTCGASEVTFAISKANHAFKSNIGLMNYASLRNQIRVLRKSRVNPYSQVSKDYLDALDEFADMIKGTDKLVGLVNTTIRDDNGQYHRGVYYHHGQFVLAEITGGQVKSAKLILIDPEGEMDQIELPAFVDRSWDDKPLGKGFVGQSRLDLIGLDFDRWATSSM